MRTLLAGCLALSLVGCGGGGGGGSRDFGQYEIALTADCEGVAGLTGQAILDARTDHAEKELGYITATGDRVDLTALTIDLAWPDAPAATCYPAYEEDGIVRAEPRVAIEGLDLELSTADGKFAESLGAKGWYPVINGFPQMPQMIAVTTRGKLDGTWEPFPEYEGAGNTINFVTVLVGSNGALTSGNVGLSARDPQELDAAIFFGGGFAVATW